MVYGVLQLINFAHSEVFMYGTFAVALDLLLPGRQPGIERRSGLRDARRGARGRDGRLGAIALLLERVAYRPLIKRGAPRLIALISAIGASFVLAEAMGLRGQIAGVVGLDDDLERYVARSARHPRASRSTSGRSRCSTIGDYTVDPIDLLVIISALVMMIAARPVRPPVPDGPRHPRGGAGPGVGGADGRQLRPASSS